MRTDPTPFRMQPANGRTEHEEPMSRDLPGKNTVAILERGIPFFRGGLTYRAQAEAARRKGHRRPAQILLDRARRATRLRARARGIATWTHAGSFAPKV